MKKIVYSLLFIFLPACTNNPGKTKAEKIDYLMQESFKHNEFVGNVLVADHGQIIYKRSWGKADQAKDLLNSDTAKFLIGSLSKPVTAILVLRLVEKGVLKLDATINSYFKIADTQIGKITIHQLLTHTSGLNEIINKKKGMDIKALVGEATLRFEPGSDFEYSNSGYVLLKEIIQIATGRKYAELIQTEIFGPANMTSSGIARNSDLNKIVKGYKDAAQTASVDIDFPLENIDGAGTVYSTTGDLYKLDRALYAESILSEKMKEQMLKQHVPGKYCYGWFVRERGGIWDVYYHKGTLPGFASFISRRVQKDQLIVLLSNAENAEVSDIENGIAKILKK